MEYKLIENNLEKINLGKITKNNDNNILIPILYDQNEIFIKYPNYKLDNKYGYFSIEKLYDNSYFSHFLKLDIMKDIDYFDNDEEKEYQNEAINFSNFLSKLKNKIMTIFFNKLKTDKNYLDINLNKLNLEEYEMDKAIWDSHVDYSYELEYKKIDENEYIDDEDKYDMVIRHRFHVNSKVDNPKKNILNANIIFINKKLDNKKHIYIEWKLI